MNKRSLLVGSLVLVMVFGSGFLLGRTNVLGAHITDSYLSGRPADVDFTLFWEAWNKLAEKYPFGQPTVDEKIYGAIRGLSESYNDPYTVFFDPKEAKTFGEDISGSFGGVGIEIGTKEGLLTVIAPLKDTPADRAHIVAGDIISSIDGTNAVGMNVEEAIQKIRGTVGTEVKLGVISKGSDKERTVTLKREVIHVTTLETKKEGDVFVVSLYSFSEDSANLFKGAMKQFQSSGLHKLVIDLRDNPGGYLDAATEISSWLLPQGTVIVREDLGEDTDEIIHRSKGYDLGIKNLQVVVLVNEGSASASEILAGALHDHGVAKLVGEHTFGKGSVQELVSLSHNTTLKVTVARWLTPNGLSLNEHSLEPDIKVDISIDDIKANKDPQLAKALEILK